MADTVLGLAVNWAHYTWEGKSMAMTLHGEDRRRVAAVRRWILAVQAQDGRNAASTKDPKPPLIIDGGIEGLAEAFATVLARCEAMLDIL